MAGGTTVALRFVTRSGQTGTRVNAIIAAVVDQQSARVRAARFVAQEQRAAFPDGLARVDAVAARLPQVTVETSEVGTASATDATSQFDPSAYTELLLFMFIMSLTSSSGLLETQRLGVTRRMASTPTTAWAIVEGQALGQFAVTVVQGLTVMFASALLFGVHWGDPLAAGTLMVAFSLVASGAGMLLGVLPTNERISSALGVLLSLGLAALGGTMMPLEYFSPTMRTVAHLVTPHAWAVDGFSTLIREHGNLTDIAGPIAVLLAVAGVLLSCAAGLMRRSIVR